MHRNSLTRILLLAFAAAVHAAPSHAVAIALERPGDREFIRDLAYMVDDADEIKIKETCDKLLTDKAIPIVVVTVEDMARYGGEDLRIETFALLLFDQWEIGIKSLNKQDWNKGILLLVSRDDRLARIELGAGWGKEQDALCEQIMEEQIVARFRNGKFSAGILNGVLALEKMARGEELPKGPFPWRQALLMAGFAALLVFTVASLVRRGASGWAWLFWGAVFSLLGYMLYSALSNRSGRGSGGFSGGSFGGGFSGGGGATGSW